MVTEAERERLEILIEECSEVIKESCKILRHGWITTDRSVKPSVHYNNQVNLSKEVGHVIFIINNMMARKDLQESTITAETTRKEWTINPYLHHQRE